MILVPIFQASFSTQLHAFAAIGAFVLMPIVVTVAGILLDVAILRNFFEIFYAPDER